jgi:hypothetical protein
MPNDSVADTRVKIYLNGTSSNLFKINHKHSLFSQPVSWMLLKTDNDPVR